MIFFSLCSNLRRKQIDRTFSVKAESLTFSMRSSAYSYRFYSLPSISFKSPFSFKIFTNFFSQIFPCSFRSIEMKVPFRIYFISFLFIFFNFWPSKKFFSFSSINFFWKFIPNCDWFQCELSLAVEMIVEMESF